ncbi:MAG: PDZ domain-containing protein [Planctomycetes bacterium]|nr:PDZ domain-containing protein [Planctomycetota bacterium]
MVDYTVRFASALFLTFVVLLSPVVSPLSSVTRAAPDDTPVEIPAQGGLQKGQLVNAVFAVIGRYYIDFNSLKVHEVLADAMKGVETAVPNLMVSVDTHAVKVQIDGLSETFEIGGVEYWADLRDLLKEILHFIESTGRCSASFSELEYAALSSVLTGFDPYCKLYQPKDFKRAENLGASSFVGLGMDIEFREGSLAVIEVYENSPARQAGLEPGDRIIEIDGESARKMSLREALQRLAGQEGTYVSLSVIRDGVVKSYTLKRQRVKVENVTYSLLDGDVGYIRIGNFQDNTYKSVAKALEELKKSADLNGLVIDFRGNYGGVLDETLRTGDLLLSSGIVNIKVSSEGGYPDFVTAGPSGNREERYPLVVLIDEGSASSAEILAAAFKENDRAIVMGEQSFGKASIQQVFGLKGKYAIKLTTARYYTPLGRDIQYVGLAPDVLLVPIKVDRRNPTLTRRVHYLNEGLIRDRIERPVGEEKPSASLVYLDENTSPRRPAPENDYQVRLARRLIEEGVLDGGTVDRERGDRVLRQMQKEEEKKIVSALEGQGIDWSSGIPDGVPNPLARINLDREFNEVDAGGSIYFIVNVENRGDGALYRVLGRSSSTNPAFEGLEFPVGQVDPGQSESYTLKVDIPEDSLDRRDEVTIKFTEDNDFAPDDLSVWVTTWAQTTPVFAYTYKLLNYTGGKNDGLIKQGEKLELVLNVKNIGEGDSKDTVVMLRPLNPEGVTVENPRVKLGLLKSKGDRAASFKLTVHDTPLEQLRLEVIIADINLGINLSSKLSLPVERRHVRVTSYSGLLEVAADGGSVYGGRSRNSPVLAPLLEGSVIAADGRVNEWFRVPLTGGVSGWVNALDVRRLPADARNKESVREKITPLSFLPFRPPVIRLKDGVLTARRGDLKLSFQVEDDQDVRVVYIIVNDVKVFYEYNTDRTTESDITAEILITRGLNLVRIIAYDDQGLATEKPFVITGV